MRTLLLFSIVLSSAASPLSADSPGRDYVRSHDFTAAAMVLSSADHLDAYTQSGFSTLLGWDENSDIYAEAAAQGLPWFIHAVHKPDAQLWNSWQTATDPVTRQEKLNLINEGIVNNRTFTQQMISTYAGNKGLLVWDEPKPNEMDFLIDAVRWAKATYQDRLVYTNMNAYNTAGVHPCNGEAGNGYDYSDHVADVIRTGVDLIAVDAYPFRNGEGNTSTYLRCRYYASLESVRNRALAANIPYWNFAQAAEYGSSWVLPSESDLRLGLFAPLAYGYTGLQLFLYHHSSFDAVIAANRAPGTSPSTNYPFNSYVSTALAEVRRLGRTLRLLKSQLVRHVRSQATSPLAWGVVEFEGSTSNPIGGITAIEITSPGANNNGLVGFFEDDNQHNYFMIVNTKRATATLANQATLEFKIHVHPGAITQLYKMRRDNGAIEQVQIVNNVATVTIPGGTGELFKINSESFVGIE